MTLPPREKFSLLGSLSDGSNTPQPVERGVSKPDDAVARRELERDEIPAGARDDDVDLLYLHREPGTAMAQKSWKCATIFIPSPPRNRLSINDRAIAESHSAGNTDRNSSDLHICTIYTLSCIA